ncbi:MAG: hypothetical protein JWN36_2171 [Microbacteriaceae bacterium]|jgi:hypothetical protein|nr:hypothetical protein [Microbacteriaceae bacterium]
MLERPDPRLEGAHHDLTRKFIGSLVIAIVGAIVALGLLALRYGATDAGVQTGLLVGIILCLVIAVIAGVFAARFARRIGRLGKS